MSLLCAALAVAAQSPAQTPVRTAPQPPAASAAPASRTACANAPTWRPVATIVDRQRLRDGRLAWTQALTEAGNAVGTDPLFDPDHALDRPLPPPGAYRCRLIGIGGAARLVEREWGRCEIDGNHLVKLDGPQRPTGKLYADSETRGVFLGTLLVGDETRPVLYGRDRMRDLIGVVERVDVARWRVAVPRRTFGATMDLLELVATASR